MPTISSTVKYICPECKEVVFWSAQDFATKGDPACPYDGHDMARQEDFCPHCEILLKPKMFDVDGTNLEERFVCENCGYGSPSLR